MDWERESLSVSHARSSEFSPLGVSAWHIAIVIAVAPAPAAAVRAQVPSRQLDAERLRAGRPVAVVDHVQVRHRVERHHGRFTSRLLAAAVDNVRDPFGATAYLAPAASSSSPWTTMMMPRGSPAPIARAALRRATTRGGRYFKYRPPTGSLPAVRSSTCGPDHAGSAQAGTRSSSPGRLLAWQLAGARGGAPPEALPGGAQATRP